MRDFRPRFRLKTMMISVALAAVPLSVFGGRYRREEDIRLEIIALDKALRQYKQTYGDRGGWNCRGGPSLTPSYFDYGASSPPGADGRGPSAEHSE